MRQVAAGMIMREEERTTVTLLESAFGRIVLRRESDRDIAEVIREFDGRTDVGERKVRVYLSRHFEFGTDLENPIFVLC